MIVRGRVGYHMLNLMSMYSPMLEVCLICPHAFLLEVYFMHELWLGRRDESHVMWYEEFACTMLMRHFTCSSLCCCSKIHMLMRQEGCKVLVAMDAFG